MAANRLYESDFEETTIERLKRQDYTYVPAHEWMTRNNLRDVVMEERLLAFLHQQYPFIPKTELPRLVSLLSTVDGLTVERRNEQFHQLLVNGYTFSYEEEGETKYVEVFPIDWEHPLKNDFVVMNQLAIDGRFSRRPDIIIYVNGFPLVVFELKSPYREDPSVHGAHLQLQHYVKDIPQLFNYNALVIVADGVRTMHGMPFASMEYFAEWKSLDGHTIENNPAHSMKTLIEGLFPKERLLEYIHRFIFFKKQGDGSVKIGAKYHQYFGAKIAYQEALRAAGSGGNKKIGTIFHSTGSGKSFTMLFLSNLLKRSKELQNPTIILQVDRTDLDEQLYKKTFVAAGSFIGNVEQAKSGDDLRELLRNENGQVVLSTIEKFRLKDNESEYPVLSDRHNIIVIADEAHRTQYGVKGFAGNLRLALPNASHVAFTGTPISMMGKDTTEQFGPIIHTYDMVQSVQDGATVKLTYESRLIPLDLTNVNIDEDFADIVSRGSGDDALDEYKRKFAALKKVVGTPVRLQKLAKEIVTHFNRASIEQPFAKGLIVTMSRDICVALYDDLKKIPHCPPVEVIMTGGTKDPVAWKDVQEGSQFSHIKNDEEKKIIKERLADPNDPLKLCLVVDMFLTGSDFPPMTYLYVDKPMKGHNLIQAIARVNRVFPEKESGQIIDFIGIIDQLKEATKRYTNQSKVPTQTLLNIEEALQLFWDALGHMRTLVPDTLRPANWKSLDKVEREDILALLVGLFLDTAEEKDFLEAQLKLAKAYKLVLNEMSIRSAVDEVLLYEIVKTQIRKIKMKDFESEQELERKLSHLVDISLTTKETIDIFAMAGIEKPDISILDESFTFDVKDKKHQDLRFKLFKQLLEDQIQLVFSKNKDKSKSMSELLEKTLQEYHNRIINTADVIHLMVSMQNDLKNEVNKRRDLGLSEEEVSFYEVIAAMGEQSFTNEYVADLVRKIVRELKKELKPGWTEAHRTDVMAKVRLAVTRTLIREKVTGQALQFILKAVVQEATEKYKDWPAHA